MLGWQDISQRHHRSTLGPFWFTINLPELLLDRSCVHIGTQSKAAVLMAVFDGARFLPEQFR